MTSVVLNVVLAVLALTLAALLARQGPRNDREAVDDRELVRGVGDGVNLDLVTRIFDAGDYRWLREGMGFPELAEKLLRHRQELALRWLRGLRCSFNELVRTPQPGGATGGDHQESGDWPTLFLTLRFHLLLIYALTVVRLWGPYHRLVPSCGWVRALLDVEARRRRLRTARADGVS